MSAVVATLPTRANVELAWEEYRALAVAMHESPSLLADQDHCKAVARAWKRWFDLFIMMDGKC